MPNANPSPDHDPTVAVPPSSMLPISLVPATRTGSDTLGVRSSDAPTIPERFGEFRILGELGRGGMGVVYRAEDPNLKREIAIKVMLPQYAANPDAKARFVREARSQAKVEHEHVAAIFHVAEHAGVPYLVMPLLKGMTLQAAIKANPRPPLTEVIRITREVAEGLAAAHEKGLVHRDIKPANIWLEGKKLRVRVLDFGLARAADVEATDTNDGPLTAEGAIVGTPAYMSPEQARGDAVDGRTDLFSLGVMLYQMSAGELPFRGGSALAVLSALALHVPPPLSEKNPSVPPALSNLTERLLSKTAAGRPATAEAAAEELRAIELGLAGAVRVIPLGDVPPIVVADVPAGPDPFADLDATEANSAPDAEPIEDAEPVSARMPMKMTKSRTGSPVWAMVGGVLLAVVGVIGFVISQTGKKPEPEVAKIEEPPKKGSSGITKKDLPVEVNRKAADLFNPYASLQIQFGTPEKLVQFAAGQLLPTEPFKLTQIWIHPTDPEPPADFATRAIPAVLELGALRIFHDANFKLRWTDADIARLATSPLKETLISFRANIDPTPKAWDALKQFHLHDFMFNGSRVTDQSVAELPPFVAIKRLEIPELGKSGGLTAKGCAKLLNIPDIKVLILDSPTGISAEVGKVIAGLPGLSDLSIIRCELDDACIREISNAPDLRDLQLPTSSIPSEGLKHFARAMKLDYLNLSGTKLSPVAIDALATIPRLKQLQLRQTGATEADAKKLNAALPRCRIYWEMGTLEPTDVHYGVAERNLGAISGNALLKLASGKTVEVIQNGTIPDEPFTLAGYTTGFIISDEQAKEFKAISTLTKIAFTASHLTADGLRCLLNSRETLTSLMLVGTGFPITNEMLDVIGEFSNLKSLHLVNSQPTTSEWKPLSKLKHLEGLKFVDPAFTNEGLKHVAALPKLVELDLADTPISDAGIETLGGMKVHTRRTPFGRAVLPCVDGSVQATEAVTAMAA